MLLTVTFRHTLILTQTQARRLYRVSHVRLKVKASWWAEHVVVGLHQLLFVPVGFKALCSALQSAKACLLRCFHVLFCR